MTTEYEGRIKEASRLRPSDWGAAGIGETSSQNLLATGPEEKTRYSRGRVVSVLCNGGTFHDTCSVPNRARAGASKAPRANPARPDCRGSSGGVGLGRLGKDGPEGRSTAFQVMALYSHCTGTGTGCFQGSPYSVRRIFSRLSGAQMSLQRSTVPVPASSAGSIRVLYLQ